MTYGDPHWLEDDGMVVHVGVPAYGGEVVAYLPHSCDEWVIGGPDECRQLMADLMRALAKLEGKDEG